MQANTYKLAGALPRPVTTRWTEQFLLTITLVVVDCIMTLLGFWLAYLVRFELGLAWFYQYEITPLLYYQRLVLFLAPVWVIVFWLFGLYDFKNLFSGTREYARVFNACTLGLMLVIHFSFFEPYFVIARAWLLLSWLLVVLSVSAGRFATRRLVQLLRVTKGHFLTRTLVVGANEEAQAIAQQLRSDCKTGVLIVGFADDEIPAGSELLPDTPVLGSVDALMKLVQEHSIQEIIIASSALEREKLLEVFRTFGTIDAVTLRMSSGFYEILTTGVEVQEIGNVPLISVNKVRLTGVDVVLKAMLDLFVSTLMLLASWPILLTIAVAVKIDSSGPVFYRRRVVGVGGKVFDALKFRTMYVDADDRLARDPELRRQFEVNYKLKDDPRVTRIGRFLRRTSLDELPQLFNVLRGQMSLVGPRMITLDERSRYGKWHMNLFTVKPGITGLWQVSGRSDVGYEERVMLDMHYIRNYSIWLDLYVLWRTVPAVLKGHGAY
jgi:exopolysaccharide biosynthesis polyprenyl glycosylphosphotransferase